MEKWNLPNGWVWKTFPEICEVNPPRPRIQRSDDVSTSFVPMQAVDDVDGKIADMQTRPFGDVRRGYTYFEENDVLLAKITPSMENGKAAVARGLVGGFGFGTTEFHVFHPHEGILPDWIFYYIRRKTFRIEAKAQFRGAVGQQRVPEDFLLSYPIPIPYPDTPTRSLETQRRIVVRLEVLLAEVSEARKLQEEMVEDIKELFQAILVGILQQPIQRGDDGWGTRKLVEIAPEVSSQVSPKSEPDNEFNYWGLDAIAPGQVVEPQPNYVTGKDIASTCVSFSPKHVLYGKLRPYLNKVIVPSVDGIGTTEWVVLAPDLKLVDRFYLGYVLRTPAIVQRLTTSSTGARMPRARKDVLFATDIPIPYRDDPARSLKAQQAIAFKLNEILAEIIELQKGQQANQELLGQVEQSLLAQAFRGEL